MKKKLFVLIFALLISSVMVFAQTTIVDCSDLETIDDRNTWTLVNGSQTNQWVFGTAANDGYSLYISNSPSSSTPPNEYSSFTDQQSNVWAYKDVKFPNCDEGFVFSFDWRCYGETATENLDFMYVYIGYPISVTAGDFGSPSGLKRLTNPLTGNYRFSRSNTWQHFETSLPIDANDSINYSEHNIRLYFFWHNDNMDEGTLPAAVDNICIHSLCSSPDAIPESAETVDGESIILYPNPTSGTVSIRLTPGTFSTPLEIQVFDIYGQLIDVMHCNGEKNRIDLSAYATGVYLIKLVDNGNVIGVQKVVKN